MARFDVFRLPGGALALDCQSDLLDHLDTRFTVPLLPVDGAGPLISGLHPRFDLDGRTVVMATHLAGAVPARALKDRVATLESGEYDIQRALDTLTGSY